MSYRAVRPGGGWDRARRAAALTLPLAIGGVTSVHAQADWQQDLAAEILILEDCEVGFLTQVIERTVGGREVVMAKVHCLDGRTFDAERDDRFAAFDFRACEPVDEPASC